MRILPIISSPCGAASFSIKLGDGLVEHLQAANPSSTVTVPVHDLATQPLPQLEEAYLQFFFTPVEHRTPAQQEAVRHSDEAIAELPAAGTLVIGAPLYNFGIAST